MRFFLASLVLAITSSLVWIGIALILWPFFRINDEEFLFGGIIIVVALSFGIPLIIRLFKAKREDP